MSQTEDAMRQTQSPVKRNGRSSLILIGMPGAGKSTLGVVLAKILNKDFLDCDLAIQQQYGKTLQQLIDEEGTEGFIACEGRALKCIEATNCIIATGGSAVYSPAAMHHLAQLGPVVYLRVTLESLYERLGDLHERGVVLQGVADDAAAQAPLSARVVTPATTDSAANFATNHKVLEALYKERYHLYEEFADIIVDVDNLAISDAALKVAAALAQADTARCSM